MPPQGEASRFLTDYALTLALQMIDEIAKERGDRLASSFSKVCYGLAGEAPGLLALRALRRSGPMSLKSVARACGYSRRWVLPGGAMRESLERLQDAGVLTNVGTQARPRLAIADDEDIWAAVEVLCDYRPGGSVGA